MKNLIQAVAVILFAASDAQAQQAVQWKVSDGGNGHWYAVDFEFRLWASAESYARSVGGHLATTASQSELDFIRPFITNTFGADYWLGASRQSAASPWRWVTAEPFVFTRWEPGAPDNGPGSLCLEVIGRPESPGFGMWNDEAFYAWGPGNYSVIEWSADCNGDGIVDYGQCRDGTLPDYNGNNVPDCCESSTPCVVGSYPVQWRVKDGGNGHWYQLNARATPVSWTAANAESASLAGHLATLTSAAENQWVFSNVAAGPDGWNCGSDCYGPWLGGYQDPQDPSFSEPAGGWKWVTGETWGFAPWSCELPNDADPLQDFLHFYSVSWCSPAPGPRWDDLQDGGAGRVSSFVIEWSADCNSDGVVDKGQILRGQLQDANADGVPDVCQQPTCRDADFFPDRNVNGADLGLLLSQWGTPTQYTVADLNRDGAVDGIDLGLFLSFWGSCPY